MEAIAAMTATTAMATRALLGGTGVCEAVHKGSADGSTREPRRQLERTRGCGAVLVENCGASLTLDLTLAFSVTIFFTSEQKEYHGDRTRGLRSHDINHSQALA